MEIPSATLVGGVGVVASKPQAEAVVAHLPTDHVSAVDTSRMEDMARDAQARVSAMRSVRLAQVQSSIRAGNYQPSASQIANRLLDAAEIDANMRAILSG